MDFVATVTNLSDRVRLELGDQSSPLDVSLTADGTSVQYALGVYPVDGSTLQVFLNGTIVASASVAVSERTGTLVFSTPPAVGVVIRATGVRYRYFGSVDMTQFVNDAAAEHLYHRTNNFGSMLTLANLPQVEEYPVSLLATTFALYALATDASFDIDISAPDGVTIPRSERFRQLMDMLATRQQQYRDLCAVLNVGLYRIEVFDLRRVSRTTNRLVPVYVAQEIDDSSLMQRVYLPTSTLGGDPVPSSAVDQDFTVTQGDTFNAVVQFPFSLAGYTIAAQIRLYPGTVSAYTTITCTTPVNGDATQVQLSMLPAVTTLLPLKSFWDLQLTSTTDPTNVVTYMSGFFFSPRQVTM